MNTAPQNSEIDDDGGMTEGADNQIQIGHHQDGTPINERITMPDEQTIQLGTGLRMGKPSEFHNNDTGKDEFYQEIQTREGNRWEGFCSTISSRATFLKATTAWQKAASKAKIRTPEELDKEITQAAQAADNQASNLAHFLRSSGRSENPGYTDDQIQAWQEETDAAIRTILVLREERAAARNK